MTAPRGFVELTVDEALELLRRAWTDKHYIITYDEMAKQPWRAWRLDRVGRVVDGTAPDELNDAIRADQAKDGNVT